MTVPASPNEGYSPHYARDAPHNATVTDTATTSDSTLPAATSVSNIAAKPRKHRGLLGGNAVDAALADLPSANETGHGPPTKGGHAKKPSWLGSKLAGWSKANEPTSSSSTPPNVSPAGPVSISIESSTPVVDTVTTSNDSSLKQQQQVKSDDAAGKEESNNSIIPTSPVTTAAAARAKQEIAQEQLDNGVIDATASTKPPQPESKPTHKRHRSLTALLKFGWPISSSVSRSGSDDLSQSDNGHNNTEATTTSLSSKSASVNANGSTSAPASRSTTPKVDMLSIMSPACFKPPQQDNSLAETSAPVARNAAYNPSDASGIVDYDPVLPDGLRGIVNTGNTCFVTSALQCLRHTPNLPLMFVPNLHELASTPPAAAPPAEDEAEDKEKMVAISVKEQEESDQKQVVESTKEDAAEGDDGRQPAAAENSHDKVDETPLSTDAASKEHDTAAAAETTTTASDIAAEQQQPEQKRTRPAKGVLTSQMAALITKIYCANTIPHAKPTTSSAPATTSTTASNSTANQTNNNSTMVSALASGVDPSQLLEVLSGFPTSAELLDGRQHDCQEVLGVLIGLLREDLLRRSSTADNTPPPACDVAAHPIDGEESASEEQPQHEKKKGVKVAHGAQSSCTPSATDDENTVTNNNNFKEESKDEVKKELEVDKARRVWQEFSDREDNYITDTFAGQLLSAVTCHKCGERFTMYEPFFDLSLPLAREGKGGSFSWLRGTPQMSLNDCLAAYTAEEKMDGNEAFDCATCGTKTTATKRLSIQRFPDALILHIKRFRHKGTSTDKLNAAVSFPLDGLSLNTFASPECDQTPEDCVYDLYAVSNHTGTMLGGHYTAMCRVRKKKVDGGDDKDEGGDDTTTSQWYSFNDEHVNTVNPNQVVSPNAYILFYARRKYKPAEVLSSSGDKDVATKDAPASASEVEKESIEAGSSSSTGKQEA